MNLYLNLYLHDGEGSWCYEAVHILASSVKCAVRVVIVGYCVLCAVHVFVISLF
jgi:hypothetical protein